MNPLETLGNPLGAPISGTRPEGEHGTGTGLSGGHGVANASNTQSGGLHNQSGGFNAGLGGEHASAGIPHGHSGSSHPIADKFTSGSSGVGHGESRLDNKLDQYSGADRSGHSHSSHGVSGGDAVSGAYAGSGTNDALTGESHAQRTGAGVGPLGENTHSESHSGSHSGLQSGLQSGSHSGSHSGAGPLAAGVAGLGAGGAAGAYGTGVGASGGAGGHYSESPSGTTGLTGSHGNHDNDRTHGTHGDHGSRGAAGVGAGAVGAGALGAGAASHHNDHSKSTSANTDPNATTGRFGTVEKDFDRGAPLSKDLDTGGPHSLVFQESTGKYVHRHDLEGSGSATKHN